MFLEPLWEYLYSLARDNYHYELHIMSSDNPARTTDIMIKIRDPKLGATVGGVAINLPSRDLFVSAAYEPHIDKALNELEVMVMTHRHHWRDTSSPPEKNAGCHL